VRVTLSATQGTLTLASTAGLTLAAGANGSATLSYTGTVANLNAALSSGLTFTPTTGFRGLAQITLATDDQGNSGSGGALADTDVVNVHVGAIVVTNASDASNGTVTSIAALVASDGGDGISLREAITAANATAGADFIEFDIAGTGIHTINVLSALPTLSGAVTIDATSDDSFAANGSKPAIELKGSSAGAGANGLTITAGNSTVKGLVIDGFSNYGLFLQTGGGNVITGNYIGTNAAGTAASANTWGIVLDNSAGNTIGGTAAADRNVISGNTNDGINIGGTSNGNLIQGNYIGTNAAGTAAVVATLSGRAWL